MDTSSFVEIASLHPELRPASQVRAKADADAVDAYAEAIDEMPPVTVYEDGNGIRWLADGFHTVNAAIKAGRTEVKAKVVNGEYLFAFGYACQANRKHGVRPSPADKRRRVVEAFRIPENAGCSDRAIAVLCGVSPTFVGSVRKEVDSVVHVDNCGPSMHDSGPGVQGEHVETVDVAVSRESIEPQVRTGRDGKKYTVREKAAPREPQPLVVGKNAPEASDPEPLKCIVNGVPSPDTEDIAATRASGKIGANTVVEVTIPDNPTSLEDVQKQHEEEQAAKDAIPDDEWLQTLPLFSQLKGRQREIYREDALLYRHLEAARKSFRHHASREANKVRRKEGAYYWKLKFFLGTDAPDKWVRCPQPCEGGCGGSGQIDVGNVRECGQCRGRGFRINA